MVNTYKPATLAEALKVRAMEAVTPYAGGTDLMIEADEDATYLFLSRVAELREIKEDAEYLRIGAAVTFTELLKSNLTPAILKEAVAKIAAPAIRNLGTAGGNICNGSPKADSALIFFVTDSKLRLVSAGGERIVPIKEFYLGRNSTDLKDDELLAEILMPKTGIDNYYYKKIGARNALAISRVSFAGVLDIDANGVITNCACAFGAVSAVVIREPSIDAMLIGKTVAEAKAMKADYLKAYDAAIVPIRGRISAEYRKTVCLNLVSDWVDSWA